ncbi:MAG: sensor histidine kinase, partial [Planctomycetales bacterium]|nr:sensor histidine kinase [Planctomycetales bacterium]
LGNDSSFKKQYSEAWQQIHRRNAGQLMSEGHQFTYLRVSATGKVPVEQETLALAADEATDEAAESNESTSLILLVDLSPQALRRGPDNALRHLIPIYVGAVCIVAVLSGFIANATHHRKQDARKIADSAARLRVLSSQLLTAHEEERRRISRDLHDELGQLVTAINLDIKLALIQTDAGVQRNLMRRAVEASEQLLKCLHEIAERVRPSILDDLGLEATLLNYLAEFSARTQIQVASQLSFHHKRVPVVVGENVFRIVQEALTNAAKHAQTASVVVTVSVENDAIRLFVRDHGVGTTGEQSAGSRLGILGMRERTELLNGEFQWTSAEGQGTTVEVTIPLEANNDLPAVI